MKFAVVQCNGVADEPIADLGGKTPLEAARTPNLDHLAARGILGLSRTIPRGMPPASDVGTMSILGYDPARYHTGRAPLEAASLGVELGPEDVAFRLDLVTLEQVDGREVMCEGGASRLTAAEAAEIGADLQQVFGRERFGVHPGAEHGALLVWRRGECGMRTVSPQQLVGRPVAEALPQGPGAEVLGELMDRARPVVADHPVCRARRARGEGAPTAIWLWGQGRRPTLPTLRERFGVEGSVMAAVELVNGLGVLAGLARVRVTDADGVPGAALRDRAASGLRALTEREFLLLHLEVPDSGTAVGETQRRIEAIEAFDAELLGPLLEGLRASGDDWRLLVMPDHPTPCGAKMHTDDPVPFLVYVAADDRKARTAARRYSEKDAREQGIFVPEGHTILGRLLRR